MTSKFVNYNEYNKITIQVKKLNTKIKSLARKFKKKIGR